MWNNHPPLPAGETSMAKWNTMNVNGHWGDKASSFGNLVDFSAWLYMEHHPPIPTGERTWSRKNQQVCSVSERFDRARERYN